MFDFGFLGLRVLVRYTGGQIASPTTGYDSLAGVLAQIECERYSRDTPGQVAGWEYDEGEKT